MQAGHGHRDEPPVLVGDRATTEVLDQQLNVAHRHVGPQGLAELARAARRPVPGLAVGAPVDVDETATGADGGMARAVASRYGIADRDAADVSITGSPARVSEQMAAWAALGADWLVLTAPGDWRRQVELIARARPGPRSSPPDRARIEAGRSNRAISDGPPPG